MGFVFEDIFGFEYTMFTNDSMHNATSKSTLFVFEYFFLNPIFLCNIKLESFEIIDL